MNIKKFALALMLLVPYAAAHELQENRAKQLESELFVKWLLTQK